jgi:hypothetical protein
MGEADVRKSVEWLKKRVDIDDVYTPHLIFILNDYAKKYHEQKLRENGKNKLE